MLTVNILTLFPGVIEAYFQESIIGRAIEKGLLKINLVNIRDFSKDKHRKVDDEPYGGGAGMVMTADPLFSAIESLALKPDSKVILTSPQGRVFDQQAALTLAKDESLTIICGRYEGVDERVVEHLVTDEYSIGDYVLTGGELPAMVMVDAIARMIDGVVGNAESVEKDSFMNGLLDYPHYTRPAEYRSWRVPEVLLNGNHKDIDAWRQEMALAKTRRARPDLLDKK